MTTATREASTRPRLHTTRNRRRLAWSLAGVVLIAGCALGFGVVAQQLADRRPVVVLARPLERGHVLGADDLAIAQVAADDGVALVAATDSDALVGRALMTSLPAGALLTADLVGPHGLAFDDSARTIGLELEPGGYPTNALAAGDAVSVVDTSGTGTVLADAVVAGVAPPVEGATTLLVSVVVDEAAGPRVAAAAGQDRVRLLLHGAGR